MKLLNKIFIVPVLASLLLLIAVKSFGQAPSISYSPSSQILTVGTAMTSMTPTNSGGSVASIAYGTGTNVTGAWTLDHPYGVAIDASGNVYVANFGDKKSDPGS